MMYISTEKVPGMTITESTYEDSKSALLKHVRGKQQMYARMGGKRAAALDKTKTLSMNVQSNEWDLSDRGRNAKCIPQISPGLLHKEHYLLIYPERQMRYPEWAIIRLRLHYITVLKPEDLTFPEQWQVGLQGVIDSLGAADDLGANFQLPVYADHSILFIFTPLSFERSSSYSGVIIQSIVTTRTVSGSSFDGSGTPIASLKCERVRLFRRENSDASNVRWWSSAREFDILTKEQGEPDACEMVFRKLRMIRSLALMAVSPMLSCKSSDKPNQVENMLSHIQLGSHKCFPQIRMAGANGETYMRANALIPTAGLEVPELGVEKDLQFVVLLKRLWGENKYSIYTYSSSPVYVEHQIDGLRPSDEIPRRAKPAVGFRRVSSNMFPAVMYYVYTMQILLKSLRAEITQIHIRLCSKNEHQKACVKQAFERDAPLLYITIPFRRLVSDVTKYNQMDFTPFDHDSTGVTQSDTHPNTPRMRYGLNEMKPESGLYGHSRATVKGADENLWLRDYISNEDHTSVDIVLETEGYAHELPNFGLERFASISDPAAIEVAKTVIVELVTLEHSVIVTRHRLADFSVP
ncbi:hypothetical protein CLF_107450 [Clonorchis sinensis]|uniref:Uncharacterized protein n=1 Tax=Clonorchis sinensis TaxID=79923 RepID=G7YQL8_CLOSI|nr:hypothetical protein CLF_107450 [Clonorchis sinensis]